MKRKKILIAGGTGLVGSHLQSILDPEKYIVHILTRSKKSNTDRVKYFTWDTKSGHIENNSVKVDYIINLAGSGIADKRWTSDRKKEIVESRTKSIALICQALSELNHRPDCIISASAIGYYGDRSDEELNVDSHPGKGFMSETCIKWEESGSQFQAFTDRLIMIRIGIVLSTLGGALPKMLITKKLNLLNYFGSGQQYYSWIHINDLCRLLLEMSEGSSYNGIYNGVSPNPITNKEMMDEISVALGGNYWILPAPAIGLRIAIGEMADVVLNSNKVYPNRISKTNFNFQFSNATKAIKNLIESKT